MRKPVEQRTHKKSIENIRQEHQQRRSTTHPYRAARRHGALDRLEERVKNVKASFQKCLERKPEISFEQYLGAIHMEIDNLRSKLHLIPRKA